MPKNAERQTCGRERKTMNTGGPLAHAPLYRAHVYTHSRTNHIAHVRQTKPTLRRAMMNRDYGHNSPHQVQQAGGEKHKADEQRKPSAGAMRMFLSPVPEMRMMGAELLKEPLGAAEAARLDGYAGLMVSSPQYMVEDLVRDLIQVIT